MLDGPQTCSAVVQVSCRDYPDHTGPVDLRGGPKERVDGGTEPVFARSLGHSHPTGFNEQVAVRRGDVDAAGTEALAIPGVVSRQHASAAQNGVENARRLR